MIAVTVKSHYAATELASFSLPGMPITRNAIRTRAEREGWGFVEIPGIGGVRREYMPPADVMNAIQLKAAQTITTVMTQPQRQIVSQSSLPITAETEGQAQVADARKGVLLAIERLMEQTAYPLKKAARVLIDLARANDANPQLVAMLKLARDERGRPSADGLPSERSLLRFVERGRAGSLAPRYQQPDMSVPAWAPLFMQFYQKPEKPTVAHAYEMFVKAASGQEIGPVPSIWQVKRFLDKVGKVTRQMGRMGSRELKNLRPFVRRTFKELNPADIYTADGHTFDAEVQHPGHGNPFRPEITSVIDIATRRLVGWSVDLAESALAVLEALRVSCMSSGIPAIFYVDNGSGYKNALMTDEATGLMGRLGIEMHNSLPYNSQARGVIERSHQTIWVRAAKEIQGYIGADMDRQAKQLSHKISRQALSKAKGKAKAMPRMAWADFLQFCEVKAAEYNDRPHSSLPKIADPETGRKRHMSPNEAWRLAESNGHKTNPVTEEESRPLFRPQKLCTVRRGEIELFTNRYANSALLEFNGERLPVGYDIHDASRVWVYDADGRFICIAGLGANENPYEATSAVDIAKDKRAAGRERLHRNHLAEIELERRGTPALEHMDSISIPGFLNIARADLAARAKEAIEVETKVVEIRELRAVEEPQATPSVSEWTVPTTPQERWSEWQRMEQEGENENWSGKQRFWLKSYTNTPEWRVFSRKTA